MATALVYGYIDQFDGLALTTDFLKPLQCRLKSAKSARILTTFNGIAVNVDGTKGSRGRYPVEQRLDLLIAAKATGGGVALNNIMQTLAARRGRMGTLRVRVPADMPRYYTASAVLDYLEIVDDGDMADSGKNWSVIALYFQQLDDWT